jgi:hypothetical protein
MFAKPVMLTVLRAPLQDKRVAQHVKIINSLTIKHLHVCSPARQIKSWMSSPESVSPAPLVAIHVSHQMTLDAPVALIVTKFKRYLYIRIQLPLLVEMLTHLPNRDVSQHWIIAMSPLSSLMSYLHRSFLMLNLLTQLFHTRLDMLRYLSLKNFP